MPVSAVFCVLVVFCCMANRPNAQGPHMTTIYFAHGSTIWEGIRGCSSLLHLQLRHCEGCWLGAAGWKTWPHHVRLSWFGGWILRDKKEREIARWKSITFYDLISKIQNLLVSLLPHPFHKNSHGQDQGQVKMSCARGLSSLWGKRFLSDFSLMCTLCGT